MAPRLSYQTFRPPIPLKNTSGRVLREAGLNFVQVNQATGLWHWEDHRSSLLLRSSLSRTHWSAAHRTSLAAQPRKVLMFKVHSLGRGSVVRSICCSCRGPKFDFQHPRGGSQPSVTPVPEGFDIFSRKHPKGARDAEVGRPLLRNS